MTRAGDRGRVAGGDEALGLGLEALAIALLSAGGADRGERAEQRLGVGAVGLRRRRARSAGAARALCANRRVLKTIAGTKIAIVANRTGFSTTATTASPTSAVTAGRTKLTALLTMRSTRSQS